MRVSLDFDGVLTDHSLLDLAGINQRVFFKSARSAAAAGPRPGARQVAALLGCFADVVILTARPTAHHAMIRGWLARHAPELTDCVILSSGDRPKAIVAQEQRIALHIDDDPTAASDSGRVLIWRREDPAAILAAAADRLNGLIAGGSATKVDGAVAVRALSVSSVTPVFRVARRSGPDLKIRLFDTAERIDLVRTFHREAPRADDGVLIPYVMSCGALSMTTPWVHGDMVRELPPEQRTVLIPQVARFLAALHARGEPDSGSPRLISCAMDAFNLCRTPEGLLYLVDAGDCTIGSRWLDVMWTEQLLCISAGERETLVAEYIDASGFQPTAAEAHEAAAEYYGYLHGILMDSKRAHADSPAIWRRCDEIARRRRSPVSASALIELTEGASS